MHNNLPDFLVEAVNTACYIAYLVVIRPLKNETSYELCHGRKPRISYFFLDANALSWTIKITWKDSKAHVGSFWDTLVSL